MASPLSFAEEIEQLREGAKQRLSEETRALNERGVLELRASGQARGLQVGDRAPDFVLLDVNGAEVHLYSELAKGPVVLNFYRGGWGPYCNLTLKAYQRFLPQIHACGANHFAISPQTMDFSLETQQKNQLSYPVLSDSGAKVSEAFQLNFVVPDYLMPPYLNAGFDLSIKNGDDSWVLPVTGTYIVDTNGEIVFADADADYKYRVDPLQVIEKLQALVKSSTFPKE